MNEATKAFREALIECPDDANESFGSERKMFEWLLEKALHVYDKGLVNQDHLAKTDFTNNPEELVKVVEETAQGKGLKMELISKMTQSALSSDSHGCPHCN